MLPQAVSDHYKAQQRLIVGTLALTRQEWAAMSLTDLDGSWAKVAPRVQLLTSSAQLGAARNGAGYVAATLGEFGEDLAPAGLVNPRAFAGVASDGRSLSSLLDGALYRAKGMNSLESGGKWLDMAVHTQIADAGRASAATAIASYDDVGWVRMVNPPCCGACAVLSGKEFRYNQGFQRHPRCDCVHIPSTLRNPADNMGANPSLDQITDLTDAERKALAEGADLPQVMNARRGRGRSKLTTTEGMARKSGTRLTPDGIFAQAGSREEALALLRQHGYLSPYGRSVPLTRPRILQAAAQPVKKAAAWVDEIAAAKTPADVGAALQRAIGDRGKITGFDRAGLDLARSRNVATQLARLFDDYPLVRSDVDIVTMKVSQRFGMATAKFDKVDGGYTDLHMELSAGKMKAGSKAEEMFKKDQAEGWWHATDESVDAMTYNVTHEFGHLVDMYGRPTDLTALRDKVLLDLGVYSEADPMHIQFRKRALYLRENVSEYGSKEIHEMVAEAFADAELNGDRAKPFSRAMRDALRERLIARRGG